MFQGNPIGWLAVLGPGAVIASITLGTGELIFSSRGGALFGYNILFVFVLISLLKWGLVFAMSRHMVLTGVHPYTRMVSLPGPRGWFPLMLLLIASLTTPVWTAFFPGILGNLIAIITDTQNAFNGAAQYLWGIGFLFTVVMLTFLGGYTILEKVQITIVGVMILSAIFSLIMYGPDWLAMLKGGMIPSSLKYPPWLPEKHPEISKYSEWVETTRYIGVIGGAGFDYLAYTSWLREKHWGWAGVGEATTTDLEKAALDPQDFSRGWVIAPAIDCAVSFLLVVLFSAVFVAAGAIVLGPNQQIPNGDNFLEMQSTFVAGIHPWMKPVYFVGAFLTLFGTLYGTLEIAITVCREIVQAIHRDYAVHNQQRLRKIAVLWCSAGATLILVWSFYLVYSGRGDTSVLIKLMTPANLFTGVLSCGILCFLMPWIDRRFLPHPLRMHITLLGLNVISGGIFLFLGIKGYWDAHDPSPGAPIYTKRWFAIGGILAMLIVSLLLAKVLEKRRLNKNIAASK